MNLIQIILPLVTPGRGRDSGKRVKCTQCRNQVLIEIAASNDGLCGVCFRRKHPKPKRDATEPSPYHQLLNTPADQLTDNQKRDQLSGAIHWRNETRIDELLAVGTDFVSKPAKYSNETWLGKAVLSDCSLSILNKLLAAGCDPNGYLRSPKESRPLELAVSHDRFEAVQWLLDKGADPNIGRPIVAAINREKSPETQLRLLNLLLEGGADINQTFALFGNEDDRFSVLDWAVLYGISASVIEFLKSKGAIHHWKPEKIVEAQSKLEDQRIVQ